MKVIGKNKSYEIQHPNIKIICEDPLLIESTNKNRKIKNIITLLETQNLQFLKLKYNMVKKLRAMFTQPFFIGFIYNKKDQQWQLLDATDKDNILLKASFIAKARNNLERLLIFYSYLNMQL